MSLFGREQRSVYRVYAEDEYPEEETESFDSEPPRESFAGGAETESDGARRKAEPAGLERSPIGASGSPRPPHLPGGFELRPRPVAFLVVGLLVVVAAIVVVLVASSASRRALHRSAVEVPTVTAGNSRAPAGHPMPTSAFARRGPVRRSERARRPSATTHTRTIGNAPASVVVQFPHALERPLRDPPPASLAGEFGFER